MRPPALLAALGLLAACKQAPDAGASAGPSAAPSAPAPWPSAAPAGPATTEKKRDEPPQPLQLFRFSFTSEVKGKEPVDKLEAALPGKRVYAHMTFKNPNREPRSVHVVFRVNNEKRTTLDLKVDPSASYRTWAFNTLKEGDTRGQLTLEVTDETGQTLLSEKLPIKQKGKLPRCSPATTTRMSPTQRPSSRASSPPLRPCGSSCGGRTGRSPGGPSR